MTVYWTDDPRSRSSLSVLVDTENVLGTTSSESESVCPPPVPVTVKLSASVETLQLTAVTVSVEVQGGEESAFTGSAEKEPVSPDRRPETLRSTSEVKPGSGSTVTV